MAVATSSPQTWSPRLVRNCLRTALQTRLFERSPGRLRRGIARFVAARPLADPPHARNRVLCVGGLSIGGAGRTSVVTALAERAVDRGIEVAILGHGYRGRARQPVPVTRPDAREFGDEAAALHRRLPTIPIWVGADRAATLKAMPSAALILSDGGLLDVHLPRQATVMVVDATASRLVLPAGPMRASLARVSADWTWLHRCDEPGAQPLAADVRSSIVVKDITLADGQTVGADWLAGRTLRVLTGIARPASFTHLLARHGARVVEHRSRADHQWFSARDIAVLGPDWIVTAKDHARLPPGCSVNVLHIDLRLELGALDSLIDAVVCVR